jgi:hypothetical protein
MTREEVERSEFEGRRLGDLTREELLDVIGYFGEQEKHKGRVDSYALRQWQASRLPE